MNGYDYFVHFLIFVCLAVIIITGNFITHSNIDEANDKLDAIEQLLTTPTPQP